MHNCTPSGIYGALQAHAAIDDGPIFRSKNINEASFEAQLSFAKVMNKLEGKQFDVNIAAHSKDTSLKGQALNRINMGRTPEALLPKQVFGKIDKKMTQWDAHYKRTTLPKMKAVEKKYSRLADSIQKSKAIKAVKEERMNILETKKQKEMGPLRAEASASYRRQLSPQFKSGVDQLQAVYNQHFENPKKLDAELKRMGLTRQDAYHAHNYLSYLENGGPFFDFKTAAGNKAGGEMVQELTNNVTGKKVSFNPRTALFNVAEFLQKAPAVGGFSHTFGGITDAGAAAKKAGLTIFDRLPELERQGIYQNDYSSLYPEGKHDIVARSQNLLDNFSYFTGKRMGNVQKAMTGIAYKPKPWNDTFGFQDPRMKASFGFMSFQFRHMQQYGGWWKDLLVNKSPDAAKAIGAYSLMTGLIFGDRAAVPAPVYEGIKLFYPNIDQDIKDKQGQLPILGEVLNTGIAGTAAKAATAGHFDVDLTKYSRPFGGVAIGVGQDLAQGAYDAATHTGPKAAKEIRGGNLGKALAVAINGITQVSQLHKNGANALIQKTVDGVTKAYLEDEFTPEGLAKYTGQKYLGKDAVKVNH